jgi:ferric-dicitrate binding protein FerR (iron transport regulator)
MRSDDERERRTDEYLCDPGAPPQDEVADLERSLAPLRFPVETRRLHLPPRVAPRRWLRPLGATSALAATVVLLAIGLRAWFWSWPDERAWKIVGAAAGQPRSLGEGERLDSAPGERVTVRVARIGHLYLAPDSAVRLLDTGGVRHRLAVERGSLSIAIWAPPFSVSLETSAGTVADLGCAFELSVEGDVTAVRVASGWVHLENAAGEVLVPQGAESRMSRGRRAAVPVFTDAAEAFARAVRRIENGEADAADLDSIGATARRRDVYTLLLLAERTPFGRQQLLDRAAELAPPPSAAVRQRAGRGDVQGIWLWIRTLPLPPPKSWLRNWRDALSWGA